MPTPICNCGLRLALLALLVALGEAPAKAADPTSVMIIFDGSGSMWGTMEGTKQSKLALARDGLRRGLGRLAPDVRTGLIGLGHRRGDCGDVEVMIPLERLDVERIMAPLGPYNPRGRGPLTLALREAGKTLAGLGGRRSLVLIHDDADNCQQDVCAAATELKTAGVVAHVVALAPKPTDATKMACLPEATGGRLFSPQNPDQVASAIEDALRLAGGDGGFVSASAAPQLPGQAAPPVPTQGPPALYLRALLAPKAEPLSLPLHWTVTSDGQPARVVFDGRAANPIVPAAPGSYVVEARDGPIAVRQTIEVAAAAPTPAEVVLNAGTLRIRAQAQKTGMPLGDALISVWGIGKGQDVKKDQTPALDGPLTLLKGSEAHVLLPAGRYVVRVEHGLVRAERSVVVPAGSQGRIDVPLNGARLQLTASARDSAGPLETPLFSIAEDDPDAPRGRREVARAAGWQAEFVLPPGTYYVVARQGGVEARELLAVGPGDTLRRTLSVAAGRLGLSTRLVGSAQPSAEHVSYRVERIDAVPPDVVTTSRPSPVLLLPGGRYRIEGRYGVANVQMVREVEIRPGQSQQLAFEHYAATLKLRLIGPGGLPLPEVFWDVRNEAGRTVWVSGQPEPSVALLAGKYLVRAETREKRYERAAELRPGDARVIEVTAD